MVKEATHSDLYGGEDPRLIPNYGISEAATWLGLPQSTVRAWTFGQPGFAPVIRMRDADSRLLSFQNLVELHVLAVIRRFHTVSLQRIRKAVSFLRERLGVEEPLASSSLLTDGQDILIEWCNEFLNVSKEGQMEMRDVVRAYLSRVETGPDGEALRLFPFSGRHQLGAPRSIVIDPRVQFGRPCLAGTGTPTSEIVDRFKAGDSIECIAADFGREPGEVEEAIRYEHAA